MLSINAEVQSRSEVSKGFVKKIKVGPARRKLEHLSVTKSINFICHFV